MSKQKRERGQRVDSTLAGSGLSSPVDVPAANNIPRIFNYLRSHLAAIGIIAIVLLLVVGIMAKSGWLPNTDALTGKRTGWFGAPLAKNAASSWNPFSAPLQTPTPQLSKELLYAGNRLLSVVDANANETPPADLAVWRPSNGTWYVYNLETTAWTS